ncbi:MAG TPA: COX15/CtaA family protein [Thermoanaerobaculia bacterium]|nr:COX15/CtaA family protein [Thermoanaerobaculia bacterium]
MIPTAPTPVALRRFTLFVAASTLFLIFAGAMVTSTGSGLAVPDWPLSYGMVMPPMVGGIFYEHGHRMIAATVGFLTVLQALFLQRWEPKRFLRRLGWTAVGAVIAQGLLGGLTVLFLLPKSISISHAALAEIFFCLNVSIAFFARRRNVGPALQPAPPALASRVLVALVFSQILIGALMRHLGAGLAIPDFPLSFGHLVPAFTSVAIAVNFAHRLGALLVTLAIFYVAARTPRYRWALIAVVMLQLTLGALTVWSGKHPILTSLHVACGALTLAVSLLTALSARSHVAAPARRLVPAEASA